ncbi:MAG: PDZ domain-containing protein [Acidobacteria bacterium]|nr:PDZ domain-containing protein [Acidobacteriota bacterium]
MTICRSCSSEIPAPDRFCRNCGAPVAPAVAELDDTRRFHPSAPLPANAPGKPDTTNPLYASPAAAYATPQSSIPYQTASLAKKLFRRKFLWVLVMIILVIAIFGVGVGVGSNFSDGPVELKRFGVERDEPEDNAKEIRAKFEEAVQNALGFKQGGYSATEFPDQQGIFINSLMSDDSPAALAKIQAGDLMTELNNKAVRNDSELSQVLDSLKTGDDVPAKVYRDGSVLAFRIKIGDRHFPPLQPKLEPDDQGFLGIRDSARRCCIPGTKKWGVEVTELHVNGPAELFGLKPGDVITEFGAHSVKTPNEFNRRIRAMKPGSKISVTYYRGNAPQKVEVIIGHRW